MNRFLVSIFLTCFVSSFADIGFDTTDPLSQDQFSCFKNQGFSHFIGRASTPDGAIDETGIQNLRNALQAGLTVNAYMLPCAAGNCTFNITDPTVQVEVVTTRLLALNISHLNLFVGIVSSSWSSDIGQNQNFISLLFAAINKVAGIEGSGVYSSQNAWYSAFGKFYSDISAIPESLLWVYRDGRPDYSGFANPNNTFGGWKSVNQLYGHEYAGNIRSSSCAQNATLNYLYSTQFPQ